MSFDLRFPLGAGTLGAGVLPGACLFNASGVVSDAFVLLVPLGLDMQYSFGGSGPGVILHASGGAALMGTSAPAMPKLLKIVPYALAGIGLDVPFSRPRDHRRGELRRVLRERHAPDHGLRAGGLAVCPILKIFPPGRRAARGS